MKDLTSIKALKKADIFRIFTKADELREGAYRDVLSGKTAVLFFPETSIRTRISFERGLHLLGAQTILFPSGALDKKEELRDVCGYLDNWADIIIVRHKSQALVEKMCEYSSVPVINAMTDKAHPCEIISDMYALSKRRRSFTQDKYLFCGTNGNIGNSWKEASEVMGFELSQCCGKGHEIEGLKVCYDINEAVIGKDIICTDAIPADVLADFAGCRVTRAVMEKANSGALLDPCPPFFRGEEVSEDAIASKYFVGYGFKKCLLEVQQAIILGCLGE